LHPLGLRPARTHFSVESRDMLDGTNPQPPETQSGIDSAELYLRQGEPLLAYNAVQDGLRVSPGNLRLRQLKGLVLARSGDVERANQLLSELTAGGTADAETLGMLARTHKDLALGTTNAPRRAVHLASAFRIYYRAYEEARRSAAASDAWYTGINAATIAVLQGDFDSARRIAGEVRDLCRLALRNGSATTNYWLEATLGEAALILGDHEDAVAHYARAAHLAAGSFGHLASTRRQLV
jgi:tetratricopeptide (TPR) repeat protein